MTVLRSLDELLKRRDGGITAHPFALLAGAIGCYVLYGLASGFFQGGWSIALAVWKIPLIIAGSLALCLPSLYVFTGLSGAELSARRLGALVAEFAGITGLILLALMPVIWLFSASTLSLPFVVWLHVFVWLTALYFGQQHLFRAAGKAHGTILLWLVLLLLVSMQMTTYVRPVLWRRADEPLFAKAKQSFLTHFDQVHEWKP
ncbi:MAG TPA: hypothetical protein VKB93_07935 [Thermoanaerobaculia bacterium]|nr:hypothetical protein [Thermoanaerobaculia bacterium]